MPRDDDDRDDRTRESPRPARRGDDERPRRKPAGSNRTLYIVLGVLAAGALAVVLVCGGGLVLAGLAARKGVQQVQQAAADVQAKAAETRAKHEELAAERERADAEAKLDLNDPRSVLAYKTGFKAVDTGNPLVTGNAAEQRKKYMDKVVGKQISWAMQVDSVVAEKMIKLGQVSWPVEDQSGWERQPEAEPRVLHVLWATPRAEGDRKTIDAFRVADGLDVRSLRRGSVVVLTGSIRGFRQVDSTPAPSTAGGPKRAIYWHVAEIPDGQIIAVH